MTWALRIPTQLLAETRSDLRRPHAFAAERVGVVYGTTAMCADGIVVLASAYIPLRDEDYVDDPSVGARFGWSALLPIQKRLVAGRSEGAFLVHMHEHHGRPRFSSVDLAQLPPLVPAFVGAAPTAAHGLIVLSHDSVACLLWRPGEDRPSSGGRVIEVGFPLTAHDPGGLYA